MVSSHRAQKAPTFLQRSVGKTKDSGALVVRGAEDQETDSNKCRTPTPFPISQKTNRLSYRNRPWEEDGYSPVAECLSGVPKAQTTARCKKDSSSLLYACSLDAQMTCGLPQGHWATKFLLSSKLAVASRSKLWGSYSCQEGSTFYL